MAEQPNDAPQPQASAPQSEASGRAPPKQTTGSAASPDGQAPEQAKPERSTEQDNFLKEIGEKLRAAAAGLGDADKQLAQIATDLARQTSDAVRINNRSFQHELAYAVQDVEKARGVSIGLSNRASAEIERLAGSAPGLENDRMKELLRATSDIGDRGLIREIRRAGAELGQQADQNTKPVLDFISTLEHRTRLAERPAADTTPRGPHGHPPAERAPGITGRPDRSEASAPADQARRNDEATRQFQDRPIVVPGGPTGDVMNGIFRAVRGTGPTNTPPWEAGAQQFGERLGAFEAKLQQGRDDMTLKSAEKSGRAALEALEGFRTGEGAVVLNRIREAARADPGGMAGVLSEMREGGKFAELRQQFNNALSVERGASAAYDRAANALARYGEDRKGVEQVIAGRPDAANLSAKFEAMDKDIGAAASDVPSRRDGKCMIDDLSKQVAEMLQKALNGVKSFFTRGQSETATASGPRPN